jgi:elongation factor P
VSKRISIAEEGVGSKGSFFVATTADIRNGLTMEVDGQLFSVIEFQHVKPGKGGAFVRTKLKNVRTGQVLDKTFRGGASISPVRLDRRVMQYLYSDGNLYHLMDTTTYEQIALSQEVMGDSPKYLKEGMEVSVIWAKDEPIGVEIPLFCDLRVVETDPGVKGDTASGGTKPATLETGTVVMVPLFIEAGNLIKVDTRTGEYLERVE